MNRRLALLSLLLILGNLLGPAVAAPARTVPAGAIALHVSGGIVGLDDWVIVRADGTVLLADLKSERAGRALSKTERAQLAKAFETAGFFQWKDTYGGPVAADGQVRTLYFDDGTRKKSVTWTDPGTPPAGFDALMRRMRTLEKR